MVTGFNPDPNRIGGISENTDWDTLTAGTQELFRDRTIAEKIIEFYWLIDRNKVQGTAFNVNNVQAWDKMWVGLYDIYTVEEDQFDWTVPWRKILVAKEDQRAILERYCMNQWLGLLTDRQDNVLKIIPNPTDKKVPKKTTNLYGLPVAQFKDKNVWHATNWTNTPDEWTHQTSLTEVNSWADTTIVGDGKTIVGGTESDKESGSTDGAWHDKIQNKIPETDDGLSENDSTAGNDWPKWGDDTVEPAEIDPKILLARENYLGATWEEVPRNMKNNIEWMTEKTNKALGL